MKKYKFIHSLAVVCCTLALLCLMPLSMVQAEENTYNIMPLWFEEDVNLLNSTQQKYVCDNWTFVNSFDTIAYYTDSSALIFGNYSYYKNGSSGPWRFDNLYILDSDGTFSRENANDSGLGDNNNFGAVYKSNGAFNLNVDNTDILSNACNYPIPPSINLPSVNIPNISIDNEQNTYINTYGSNAIKGGRVTGIVIDYYNIYSVVQTAESDKFFNSRNDNYYVYQENNGEYIFPVYDHSELQVFAPNMNVSNQRINLVDYAIGEFSYVYVSSNNAIIQRDVSTFNIKYIDELQKRLSGYDKLPFSNSSDNKNHLEYLGVMRESEYFNTSSSSIEIPVPQEGTSGLLFYFVVTDNYSSIQNATNIDNQTIINSNMGQGFTNIDNQLNDMASTNDNGQFNQLGNELITNVESKATSLFYPVTWAIDTLDDMANVEEKAVITLPALFKTNDTYDIDFSVVENELPDLFTFIRSIIWIALAMLCINGVQNIIGGGNNDN